MRASFATLPPSVLSLSKDVLQATHFAARPSTSLRTNGYFVSRADGAVS